MSQGDLHRTFAQSTRNATSRVSPADRRRRGRASLGGSGRVRMDLQRVPQSSNPRDGPTVKIVVLDGRPMAAEREAWAGLDRLGEVEVHELRRPRRSRRGPRARRCWSPTRPRSGPTVIDQSPDAAIHHADGDRLRLRRRRRGPTARDPRLERAGIRHGLRRAVRLRAAAGALPSRRRHDAAVRDGEWSRQPDFSLRKTPLIELAGKTMGLVGYGRIGRRVGELARAFGMYDARP